MLVASVQIGEASSLLAEGTAVLGKYRQRLDGLCTRPPRNLEYFIPSCGMPRQQKQPWRTRIKPPPRQRQAEYLPVA